MTRPEAPTTVATPTPIIAMHGRYITAWEEYNTIDVAATKLNDKNEAERILRFRYADAMGASSAEANALRLAILYQVPTTWPEALILQYHIHNIGDPHTTRTEEENNALEVALDTLLDFMCDEIEHEDEDNIFQRSEHIVSERRRFRTGKLGA